MYTWGDDSFGQLGLNNGELICTQPKKIVLNEIFHVSKVQCGKFFTAGITSDGIVFKFGSKYKNNLENEFNYDFNKNFYNNNNWNFDINNNDFNCDLNNENENKRNIVFFNLMKQVDEIDNDNQKIQSNFYGRMVDIFCGEELITFINSKGDLFIYSENQGLYRIKLSSDMEDNKNYEKESLMIDSVKFIDRNFYALSKDNSIIYEFINYSYNNKSPDLFDYVQNEYEINNNVQVGLINQPYYVSALFFMLKCQEKEMRNIEDYKIKLFNKKKYISNDNNYQDKVNNDNISYYNSKLNITNKNNSNKRVSKISNMLENIFDKKIENIANNNKTNFDNKKNAFFFGKKRIQLIKLTYRNKANIKFLNNESINTFINTENTYFNHNIILNIPISEKYSNERNRSKSNIFEIDTNINEHEKMIRPKSQNKLFNIQNKNLIDDDKKENNIKEIIPKYHRNFSQRQNNNKENYINQNIEDNNFQKEQNYNKYNIENNIESFNIKILNNKENYNVNNKYNNIQENYNNENNNKNDNLLYRLNNLKKFAEFPFEKNKEHNQSNEIKKINNSSSNSSKILNNDIITNNKIEEFNIIYTDKNLTKETTKLNTEVKENDKNENNIKKNIDIRINKNDNKKNKLYSLLNKVNGNNNELYKNDNNQNIENQLKEKKIVNDENYNILNNFKYKINNDLTNKQENTYLIVIYSF